VLYGSSRLWQLVDGGSTASELDCSAIKLLCHSDEGVSAWKLRVNFDPHRSSR
jgi:hypothetical protein